MLIYFIVDSFSWGNPENLELAEIFEMVVFKTPFCSWDSESQVVMSRSKQDQAKWAMSRERKEEKI